MIIAAYETIDLYNSIKCCVDGWQVLLIHHFEKIIKARDTQINRVNRSGHYLELEVTNVTNEFLKATSRKRISKINRKLVMNKFNRKHWETSSYFGGVLEVYPSKWKPTRKLVSRI